MNSRVNSQFVIATLAEFVRVWDLGEDASLHLETTKGHATMAFTCKLGPPSAPHPNPTFPPPTSTADPAIVPCKFITTIVSELQRLPDELPELKCDKCQYFGPWERYMYGRLREHR